MSQYSDADQDKEKKILCGLISYFVRKYSENGEEYRISAKELELLTQDSHALYLDKTINNKELVIRVPRLFQKQIATEVEPTKELTEEVNHLINLLQEE